MSIAATPLSSAPISAGDSQPRVRKAPKLRAVIAHGDRRVLPEAR